MKDGSKLYIQEIENESRALTSILWENTRKSALSHQKAQGFFLYFFYNISRRHYVANKFMIKINFTILAACQGRKEQNNTKILTLELAINWFSICWKLKR